jgi:hypothetical protein
MDKQKKYIEFEKDNDAAEKGLLRGVVDGSLLTRKKVVSQFPFFMFLVFLGMIYIGNRYHAETLRKRGELLRNEVNELRSQAVFVSAELMKKSRQTEVAGEVSGRGLELKESQNPPFKIVKNKKE